MRVAFVGKGGAGKSAIAGTLARALARRGEPVLALDSDPMPGLAFSLGLPTVDAPLPDEAVEEKPEGATGPRYRLRDGLSALEAIEKYAAVGPDGVRFLQFGKLRGNDDPAYFRSQVAYRQIVNDLPADRWNLIGDLPGGTRQPFFGWGSFAQTVLVVAEPTAKSLLSARRLARLTQTKMAPERLVAVANRVREHGDVEMVSSRSGLDVIAAVPWDEQLGQAERDGQAPIDAAPDCPAVHAVAALVDRLMKESPR